MIPARKNQANVTYCESVSANLEELKAFKERTEINNLRMVTISDKLSELQSVVEKIKALVKSDETEILEGVEGAIKKVTSEYTNVGVNRFKFGDKTATVRLSEFGEVQAQVGYNWISLKEFL